MPAEFFASAGAFAVCMLPPVLRNAFSVYRIPVDAVQQAQNRLTAAPAVYKLAGHSPIPSGLSFDHLPQVIYAFRKIRLISYPTIQRMKKIEYMVSKIVGRIFSKVLIFIADVIINQYT
jgi:hypothetical protein